MFLALRITKSHYGIVVLFLAALNFGQFDLDEKFRELASAGIRLAGLLIRAVRVTIQSRSRNAIT